MQTESIIICGVGGQGILLASDILAEVCLEAGYDVKKSEVHGMSQRGGDVISTVRYGKKVYSPIIGENSADIILALEKLEALRNISYLKDSGKIIVNDYRWDPLPVASGLDSYPENVIEVLKSNVKNVYVVNGAELAEKAGSLRTMNVVLLGTLSLFLDFPKEIWIKVIEKKIPSKYLEINLEAFEKGRDIKI
ncbi:indolepyruvate oxidoreductase subunit beta [Candidatus Aminicenantes bacterium AC-708-M15]|jgi:indolepyruvate ferredoxin oxidoreductase beta subunit|nr:indolepyruvate oxidoreductase subunit beta [SCandidatus Aminicenantes bacterium Aminicenantia_JdfR_composite]MCP2596903.1 indolepyruvate oxidoreductase subunit beta [Candidatus Aminicenantes bacterium AC-335-G13]MCP2598772.1 indolepyruvate oxidoreductase subunit beta [Candidatus Aminicenantes bacterium AC-335-L06]MCP2604217.1 indolepyruvate oxidoreductase subunit beta [Candidatus Aminicenantes bacterium AC-708-M15]